MAWRPAHFSIGAVILAAMPGVAVGAFVAFTSDCLLRIAVEGEPFPAWSIWAGLAFVSVIVSPVLMLLAAVMALPTVYLLAWLADGRIAPTHLNAAVFGAMLGCGWIVVLMLVNGDPRDLHLAEPRHAREVASAFAAGVAGGAVGGLVYRSLILFRGKRKGPGNAGCAA